MRVGIVLFTRDLRVHDNPALHAACEECERVVPLFVLDDAGRAAFGASGAYVRRWIPELAGIDGAAHEPWKLGILAPAEYHAPIVDHDEAVARFRTARALIAR